MLQSTSPTCGPRALDFFTPIDCQLFLLMATDCGNCSAGELIQLPDANWEGDLVSSVVSRPANCCIVLRDMELQTCFLL